MRNTLKKLSTYLFGVLLIVSTSCNYLLSEVGPVDALNNDAALLGTNELEAALIGAYDGIQSFNLWGGSFQINGNLLAGTLVSSGRGNLVFEDLQLLNQSLSSNNGRAGGMWQSGYDAINRVNNVLADVENADEANRDRIRGEALFLRGIIHFEMNRWFANPTTGLGIPYITEPGRSTDVFPSRDNAADVYNMAIADVVAAEGLLANAGANDRARATVWAARAYLARMHFHIGNNAQARDFANNVIENGGFSLNPGVADAFSPNEDAETIFYLGSVQQDISSGGLNNRFNFNDGGGGVFRPSDEFVAFITADANDARGNFVVEDNGTPFFLKWDHMNFTPQLMNVPIIRLPELLLIRAEVDGSAADLNAVRNRAGLANVSNATVDEVTLERQRELAMEGDLIHNLRRLQRNIGSFAWDANNLVFPIPEREVIVNPNLAQNPGY